MAHPGAHPPLDPPVVPEQWEGFESSTYVAVPLVTLRTSHA